MKSEDKLNLIFEAFSNSKRRNMINTLAYRPETIGKLAEENGLTLQAMHKHTRILEKSKLIKRKKAGRTNFIAINLDGMKTAQKWLNQYNSGWGSNNETLENYIASLEHRT